MKIARTARTIAHELGISVERAKYVIIAEGIQPLAIADDVPIYSSQAVEQVRDAILRSSKADPKAALSGDLR